MGLYNLIKRECSTSDGNRVKTTPAIPLTIDYCFIDYVETAKHMNHLWAE